MFILFRYVEHAVSPSDIKILIVGLCRHVVGLEGYWVFSEYVVGIGYWMFSEYVVELRQYFRPYLRIELFVHELREHWRVQSILRAHYSSVTFSWSSLNSTHVKWNSKDTYRIILFFRVNNLFFTLSRFVDVTIIDGGLCLRRETKRDTRTRLATRKS